MTDIQGTTGILLVIAVELVKIRRKLEEKQ